jgi:GntR family transcriptional repressor for pyruvate dehydrogenase complex
LREANKVTLAQSVLEQILELITSEPLNPGDKLPSERELMERLSVGKSSVREALQGLAMMNIIETRAGRGSFVKRNPGLSKQELSSFVILVQKGALLHLIEARRTLEVEIAGLAAQRSDKGQIKAIGEALNLWETVMDTPNHLARVRNEANKAFHLAIAEATSNPIYVSLVASLMDMMIESRETLVDSSLLEIERKYGLHRKIFDAISKRDVEKAREYMEAHFETTSEGTVEAFSASSGEA